MRQRIGPVAGLLLGLTISLAAACADDTPAGNLSSVFGGSTRQGASASPTTNCTSVSSVTFTGTVGNGGCGSTNNNSSSSNTTPTASPSSTVSAPPSSTTANPTPSPTIVVTPAPPVALSVTVGPSGTTIGVPPQGTASALVATNAQLSATILMSNGTQIVGATSSVQWSVSNPAIATVSAGGLVTAIGVPAGQTTAGVLVTATDGSVTGSTTVNVTDAANLTVGVN